MRGYSVVLKRSVLKDIRAIPRSALRRIRQAIDALRADPVPPQCEKLRGYACVYRIRVGMYRMVYEVAKAVRIITVIRIGHRKDVYRML